ncbi:LamG-like jellyroll fold domain-containing protein [Nonomuraea bangladeshensis]|uniref:LamG-like jellyroll fold domain-containing protein n=1 Tax=Nonomuraea bangladeshensis TaxID=404385 RepID=UPI0031DFE680
MAGPSAVAQAEPEPAAKAAPTATAFPAPKDPDAPLRAALAEAKKQNKPVAVEEIYTEASRTWAHPDGHLTTESYAGPSQLKQPDGTWAWLDTTLVEQDGVLKPRLTKAKVAFSAGGDAPFASMERGEGQRFALTWPTKLPKPTIKANVAEYRDAAGPGADLVVTALPTGFRHDVVLRERPAGPVEYRIPVETSGLSFAERKNGGLRLSDGKGKVVAEAPEPVMWDSSGTSQQRRGGPRQATIPTDVVKENGQSVLVLKPDTAWLSDPATTFPVVVDPTSTITVTTDTVLSSLCAGAWDKPGSTTLKVGGQRASCGTADGFDYSRSYLRFDVSSFTNKPVHSASLQLFKSNHLACHQRGEGSGKGVIYAGYLQDSWTPGRMQWPNKPANTIELTSSVCASTTTQTMSWPVTNWVKRWAGGAPNSGIELRGTTESLVNSWDSYWAEFHSAEMTGTGANPPKLIVNYFLPPEIPTVTAESVDSLDGDHAIVRTKSVKIGYKSASVDGRNIDYYASVIDSTAPLPTWTTGGGATGQWSFNEFTYGTDSSGKDNPLVFPLGTDSEIDGKQGKGLLLTPTGGKLAFGSTQRPAVDTGKSYSVAGWVRLDSLANSADLLSQDGTRNSAMIVGYDSAARKWTLEAYHADTDGSAASRIVSTSAAQAGVWTHLVGAYDSAAKKLRLYVNGALAGESDHTATPWKATGSFNLNLGLRAGVVMSTRKVSYDEVRVYDRALNETEVKWMTSLTPPTNAGLPSGQAASLTYDVGNVDYFRISIRACLTGVNPPTCNESPYYRISTDAPLLPTDTETGTADPMRPILSGMVNRPSGGSLTTKYYLYDGNDVPVGAVPLGTRTVRGGERASFQIPADTVRPGGTYKWQMTACASGATATDEICTSKTAPVSFTVPGTPPPDPVEDVRRVTLGKDSFVIKAAKTDPTACDGASCPVADATSMRIGGTGIDKTAAAIGFNLDELPDGAAISEGILRLGSATCGGAVCPTDTVITATPLRNPVTGESKGSDLSADADSSGNFSLPIGDAKADIADDAFRWLLLTSNKETVTIFGEAGVGEQPSLALTYVPARPPSNVLNLVAQAGDASATASWGLPLDNGSMAMLDGYDVEVTDSTGTVLKTLEVPDPYVAISGLTNGEAHTVRVRAKTAFGQSDWEATTVTPKAVPPPPAQNAANSCIPFRDGAQSATRAAVEESGAQEYISRVKAYYQAQDAVLEGRADTIWEASGVTPSAPNTAKLSLLNTALVEEREATQRDGEPRSNSTVALVNPVVQAGANGTVRVLSVVKREWTVTTSDGARASKSVMGAFGTVTPADSTISIFVFDHCGDMTEIQVPLPAYLDPTDSLDPCAGLIGPDGSEQRVCGVSEEAVGGGATPLPLPSAGKSNKRCTNNTRQTYCEIIQSLGRKNWFMQSSVVSTWKAWDDAENPFKSWSAQRFENWLYIYPGNSKEWSSKNTFTTNLLKALKKAYEIDDKKTKAMEMRAGACYEHNLETTEIGAGLTIGAGEAAADVGLNYGQTQGETCIDRAENNWAETQPSFVADKANDSAIWIRCTARYLNSCSIDRFTHRMVGRLKVDFAVKSAKYLVVAEHAYRCAAERRNTGLHAALRHAGCSVSDPTIIGGLN